ncbi:MAG: class I tRNA ligase family protein, partial [Anaerolineales bacterium]|nr:class I tRNA ligase family protein [Anaerolineales bacterium]
YASCKPEKNLRFGYTIGDDTRRRFLIPLWNVYSFFVTYAKADNWTPSAALLLEGATSPNEGNAQLDQWILERVDETTVNVRAALDVYDAEKATEHLEFLLDDLSNWYVRRSRRRFWKSEADADKEAAYLTLYTVLVQMVRLLAPFIPFTTEEMYQNLVRSVDENAPESVHHTLYPDASAEDLNRPLLDKMRLAITTASLGRAARSSADIKLRQPLAKARVNVGSQQEQDDLLELADVIAEEINVKEIEVVSEVGELVDYKLLPNNKVLGPKFGKLFPKVRAALNEVNPAQGARKLQAGETLRLEVAGETVELTEDDVLIQTESRGGAAVDSEKGVTVAVETELTTELLQEGYARDFVRAINNLRKDVGLDISDRIELTYQTAGETAEALSNFADYVKQETLAVSLMAGETGNGTHQETFNVGDNDVTVSLSKVD